MTGPPAAPTIAAHRSRRTEPPILRLGHISDLHLADRARYPRHGITAKECERFSVQRATRLLAGLEEAGVDHLVVTGDVTMSGETAEFERARKLFERWIAAGKVTLLPGNHDVWSRGAAEHHRFLKVLGPDGRGMKEVWQAYPLRVDLSPDVTLVALDTARWGEDPHATPGCVGAEQLGLARDAIRSAAAEGRAVLLALHHHLVLPRERVPSDVHVEQMRLADADRVVRLLSEVPVAAVLHGHRHTAFRLDLPGLAGPVPVLCAGSAARAADEPARRARALIHAIERGGHRGVDILVAAA